MNDLLQGNTIGIAIIGTVVAYNIFKKTKQNYILKKNSLGFKYDDINLPPNVSQLDDFDKEKISREEFYNEVEKFVEGLKKNPSSFNFSILYHNLKELKLKNNPFTNKLFGLSHKIRGFYSIHQNTVYFRFLDAITHELFHVASTIYDKENKRIYSGFSQIDETNHTEIGTALNEGYTQVLNERFFEKNEKFGYKLEQFFARKLEEIVGQDKMTELYSSANLLGLIDELKKYASEEDIMQFIKNMDIMSKMIKDFGFNNTAVEKSHEISNFLIKCQANKLKKTLNVELNKEEIIEQLKNYVVEFANSGFGTSKYRIRPILDTNTIMSEVFEPLVNSSTKSK